MREANAALAQAQSASGAANALAGRTVVRAQFDGVVAKRLHNPGDLVEPGSGDPILRVIDPSHLEIVGCGPVGTLARMQPVRRPYQPSRATRTARRVGDRPAGRRSIRAASRPLSAFVPPRPASLTAGMSVEVEILGPEHTASCSFPPRRSSATAKRPS